MKKLILAFLASLSEEELVKILSLAQAYASSETSDNGGLPETTTDFCYETWNLYHQKLKPEVKNGN